VRKYLRLDKEQPFITLSALLAFLGIALGVMVLIVAMAIMNGFDKEFERKLFVMNYPITAISNISDVIRIETLEKLKKDFPDLQFSPYLVTNVIARNKENLEGGFLFGVNLQDEKPINEVFAEATKNISKLEKFEVIVGKELLENFFLNKNDKLTYIFTKLDPTGFSTSPRMKRFTIKGQFNSGLSAYDVSYNYTSIDSLSKILGIKSGYFHGIHIYSDDPQKDIQELREKAPYGIEFVGWWQQNGNFFTALEMEKRALFIVLMLIILIASINIISSLLMTVMNRRSEIALLLSLGATQQEIKKIFLFLGIVIGVMGILFGTIFGFLGISILENFDIISLPADVYGTAKLPVDLNSFDFISILVGAFIIVIFSALYPAYRASKVDLLQVLRNE
jgi:putative ABC transport system permease protein